MHPARRRPCRRRHERRRSAGIEEATARGASSVIVLPADIPCLDVRRYPNALLEPPAATHARWSSAPAVTGMAPTRCCPPARCDPAQASVRPASTATSHWRSRLAAIRRPARPRALTRRRHARRPARPPRHGGSAAANRRNPETAALAPGSGASRTVASGINLRFGRVPLRWAEPISQGGWFCMRRRPLGLALLSVVGTATLGTLFITPSRPSPPNNPAAPSPWSGSAGPTTASPRPRAKSS